MSPRHAHILMDVTGHVLIPEKIVTASRHTFSKYKSALPWPLV